MVVFQEERDEVLLSFVHTALSSRPETTRERETLKVTAWDMCGYMYNVQVSGQTVVDK